MGYNVLVFGVSGFVGNFTASKLKQMGHYVIGVDLVKPTVNPPHVFIKADATNFNKLKNILKEYDVESIINLVGLPHIGTCENNPHLSFITNTLSAHNILEIARIFDIKRYVFTSTAAVYGENVSSKKVREDHPTQPTTIYGWHKLEAEQEAHAYSQQYGIQSIILRLFNVYASDPTRGRDVASIFLRKLINKEEITIVGPNKIRDFIYIEDVASAIAKAIDIKVNTNYIVINIGSGVPTKIKELLKELENATGLKAKYKIEMLNDTSGYYADNTLMMRLLSIDPVPLGKGIRLWLKRLGYEYRASRM